MTKVCEDIKEITTIKYLQKNRIDIEAKCTKCGNSIYGYRCSTSAPKIIKCDYCNSEYTYNPFLHYQDIVKRNIENIVGHAKKIAFWGNNDVLAAILRAVPELESLDYEIIGSNNIMVNQVFMNRTVKSEEILYNDDIDTVIVCDFRISTYIKNYIKTRYKNKMVVCCNMLTIEVK